MHTLALGELIGKKKFPKDSHYAEKLENSLFLTEKV